MNNASALVTGKSFFVAERLGRTLARLVSSDA
jgi:hypothetical protein